MARLNLAWDQWLYGLLAGFIGGGASAVVGGFALTVVDPKDFSVTSSKIWMAMFAMFLFNGVKDAFLYLKQHPLPEVIKTVTTTEITKTVEEKQIGPSAPSESK